ncbi:MAG: carboxymuconolactone decarboxylase family protein [Myxococcales bacterium]|nr:carboxymuconolactone decarboxylase family protein [Myxococcales bacterium]
MGPTDDSHDAAAPRSGQRIAGRATAPLWLRAFYRLQRHRYGEVLEPTRVWARVPAALLGFVHLVAAVDRSSSRLPPALRSLVMVKVSQVNTCAFCIDLNAASVQKRGVSNDKLAELPEHGASPLFTEVERAALDYAVAVTKDAAAIDDELFARLRRFFDDDAIVELTALVALQNASSKFNAALRIPAQGLCFVPPRP